MSLRSARPGYNDYPLHGIDEISLPSNSMLIFSHHAVQKKGKPVPLYIYSGAMAIQWAYALNTQSTPTIGGEVVQVLSCSAGPMSITGKTAGLTTNKNALLDPKFVPGWQPKGTQQPYTPNHELFAIMSWFREYMEHAGANTFGNVRRDERAIRFQYPERGWDFWIMVTNLSGFRYDREVIAPEWSLTAEIVTDNALDYFEGLTMNSFQDYLISNLAVSGQIGLSPFALSTTQTNNAAFGNTGGLGSQDPFLNPQLSNSLVDPKQIGANFQTLVASWTSGNTDFLNGVFSALADNSTNPQTAGSVYDNLFGGDFLGKPSSTSTAAGAATVGAAAGANATGTLSYTTPSDLAYAISTAFQTAGIPGYVGVAAALQESSLNPDRTQDACTSPVCGIGLFQVNGDGSGRDSSSSVKLAGQNRVYESTQGNITPYYPASMQITAAAQWFSSYASQIDFTTASATDIGNWIKTVQGAGDPNYAAEVSAKFSQAKQLIADGATRAAATNPSVLGSFITYDQGDPRWANHAIYSGGDTIGVAGCGVTSAAIVIANLKDSSVTPIQTGDYMTQNNGFVAGEGASVSGLEDVCQHYGLTTQSLSSWTDVTNWIQAGGLVISGGQGGLYHEPYSPGGHVVVFRAIASSGNILIANPAGNFTNPSNGLPAPIAGMLYLIGVKKGVTK